MAMRCICQLMFGTIGDRQEGLYKKKFKGRNGWELITDASNPVRKQSRTSVV